MIKDPLIQVMLIVRDLLNHPENLIHKGRVNEVMALSSDDNIAVDALAPAQPLTKSTAYDGVTEVMTYGQLYRLPVTIDFYGTNAHANANRFAVLATSHISQDLQKIRGARIGSVTGVTDVKALTGQQYINRLQVELTIHYTQQVNVNVLRIDSVPIEVIT